MLFRFFTISIYFKRGFKLREALAHSYIGQPMPDSLKLLSMTPQVRDPSKINYYPYHVSLIIIVRLLGKRSTHLYS